MRSGARTSSCSCRPAHATGDRSLLSRWPVGKFERGWNVGGLSTPEKAEIRAHALERLRSLEGREARHPKVHSYYNNRAGRVTTNSPWKLIDYWRMTSAPDLADFLVQSS
jgi:hypothetical protein